MRCDEMATKEVFSSSSSSCSSFSPFSLLDFHVLKRVCDKSMQRNDSQAYITDIAAYTIVFELSERIRSGGFMYCNAVDGGVYLTLHLGRED